MSQKLEHLLFLRRTWVWIPAPHSSSQLPITLDLEDLIPSSDFLAYLYSHGACTTLSRRCRRVPPPPYTHHKPLRKEMKPWGRETLVRMDVDF